MMQWFTFLVLQMAIVYLFTESILFAGVRIGLARQNAWVATLCYCRACFGFWVGAALGMVDNVVDLVPTLHAVRGLHVGLAGATGMMFGYAWTRVAPNDAFEVERPFFAPKMETWDREDQIAGEDVPDDAPADDEDGGRGDWP